MVGAAPAVRLTAGRSGRTPALPYPPDGNLRLPQTHPRHETISFDSLVLHPSSHPAGDCHALNAFEITVRDSALLICISCFSEPGCPQSGIFGLKGLRQNEERAEDSPALKDRRVISLDRSDDHRHTTDTKLFFHARPVCFHLLILPVTAMR